MKNKISDVTNILIEQLERLNDDEVCHDSDSIKAETEKAKAMVCLSNAIVQNGMLQLRAMEIADKYHYMKNEMPNLIG